MNKTIRLICTTVLSCSFLAMGQGERGAFNGTISDTSGAGIPGAAITARDIQTGVESGTTSSNAGIYVFPYLPPGQYTITAGKQGFRSSAVENITLRVAQTLTVKLEVGLVSESINVRSEAPSIETGTTEIDRYVSTKEFETWPVPVSDGRRQIQSFIFRSLPGTVGGEFQGSINGGQNYSHEILIEGMPLGRFDLNGGSSEALFNGTIRPDIVLGQPIVIDTGAKVAFGTGTPYLNPAAFSQVPATAQGVPLRLGTAPRFLPNVRGPSFHGEDFGVAKKFVFLEKRSIEFRADAFNAFNRAGRGDPDTDITSTTFGRITGARQGPRSLQLQLRLAW